jgi:hypothetical protein
MPDAGVQPLTAWGDPELITEISSTTLHDFKPTVRGDLLELYLYRPGTVQEGGQQVFRSIRTTTDEPWQPTTVSGLGNQGTPELSYDGTEMFVVRSTDEVWTSVRLTVEANWSAFMFVFNGQSPSLSGDGLTLYYVDAVTHETMKRTRTAIGGTWGGAVNAGLPGNPRYAAAAVSPDERVFVLSGPDDMGQAFNVEFKRETIGDAWDNAQEVQPLTSAGGGNCNLATAYEMYCGMVNPGSGLADVYRLRRLPAQ